MIYTNFFFTSQVILSSTHPSLGQCARAPMYIYGVCELPRGVNQTQSCQIYGPLWGCWGAGLRFSLATAQQESSPPWQLLCWGDIHLWGGNRSTAWWTVSLGGPIPAAEKCSFFHMPGCFHEAALCCFSLQVDVSPFEKQLSQGTLN